MHDCIHGFRDSEGVCRAFGDYLPFDFRFLASGRVGLCRDSIGSYGASAGNTAGKKGESRRLIASMLLIRRDLPTFFFFSASCCRFTPVRIGDYG